jgi:hypothetical protein
MQLLLKMQLVQLHMQLQTALLAPAAAYAVVVLRCS